MSEDHIQSPRPLFDKGLLQAELKKGVRRVLLGSKVNGIIIDVSRTGLTINGYYEGFETRGAKYSNIRNPIEIGWSELERLRKTVEEDSKPKKKRKPKKVLKKEERLSYLIDDEPDVDYLDTLPVVTMNDVKYYIDANLRQRRSVDDPKKVYEY
jgi:hypothetical protein